MSQARPEIRLGGSRPREMGEKVRPKNSRITVGRMWAYLRRQRWILVSVVVLVALATAFNLTEPYLVGVAIDRYIQTSNLGGLSGIVMLMAGIALIYALVVWIYTILMIRISQYTVRDLRTDLFAKLQTLPLRFFDQRPHGELMSYLTND